MAHSPTESGHTYKIIDLVGTSDRSIDDAINTAVEHASKTVRHLRWFETTKISGHITDGRVGHYQVMLKLGCTLED